jgi:hypothetical protein
MGHLAVRKTYRDTQSERLSLYRIRLQQHHAMRGVPNRHWQSQVAVPLALGHVEVSEMKLSRREAADAIAQFLAGEGGAWAWDDFTSIPIHDRELDAISWFCGLLSEIYTPAPGEKEFCSEAGKDVLRRIETYLRSTCSGC